MIINNPFLEDWSYRIVEMENGDYVLEKRLEFKGGVNSASKLPPYIWHEFYRGTLKEVQEKRIEVDITYRPEYKTIKRIVEE